ncbi:competence type IV pilus minor pilin ComGD [Sporosarcina highlanderae]|uniref:Competence type IV pilus minor pilin ComGD n=1 Tax=Sporosarcina highlanderae TaxID=3035916 RepID=A0ABT8JV16_9BACL|nr:competence type IV pilus minor pilin ComGD [Sporosarcina highlanderae]MDN4609026.1 competence type IV pilus minor pilin ComGD [Sporosarcina highlanderae]
MKVDKQSGYTFLELLLVLSVVIILTIVIIPIGDRWIQKQSEEEALQTLIATIHHAQAYAIAHEAFTSIQFRNSGGAYSLYTPDSVRYSTIDFPEGMRWIANGNRIRAVEFHQNGHIINPGTLIIRTSTGDKRLTLQLQHGRILVYDQ